MEHIDAEWKCARNHIQAYLDQHFQVIKALPEILNEIRGAIGFGIEKGWDGAILFVAQWWDGTVDYLTHPVLQDIYDKRIVERVGWCLINNGYPQVN